MFMVNLTPVLQVAHGVGIVSSVGCFQRLHHCRVTVLDPRVQRSPVIVAGGVHITPVCKEHLDRHEAPVCRCHDEGGVAGARLRRAFGGPAEQAQGV